MSTTKKATLALLSVAILSAAVMLFMNPDLIAKSGSPPDTQESAAEWYCHECHATFTTTAREYASKWIQGIHPLMRGQEGGDAGRKVLLLPCKECGKWAVRAIRCPNDQTIFDRLVLPGNDGKCPKCGWYPKGAGRDGHIGGSDVSTSGHED